MPEMVSRRKLAEANHFLDSLSREEREEPFYFGLSAFLSASHSVMDIILYDFAELDGWGLTREDRLEPRGFELVAKAMKRKKARDFYDWWSKKLNQLSEDYPLWRERKLSIHRGYPDLTKETETIYVPVPHSSELTDTRYVASAQTSGHITVFGPLAAVGQNREVITRNVFKYGDPPEDEVKELCRLLHEELAMIVAEAKQTYWDS